MSWITPVGKRVGNHPECPAEFALLRLLGSRPRAGATRGELSVLPSPQAPLRQDSFRSAIASATTSSFPGVGGLLRGP